MSGKVELRRALGLPALTLYGVGGMLGGGIYALVGEVAGLAGGRAWLCFLVAMAVAAPTALVYAELGARHPKSGGESWFSRVAFGGEALPFLVGWLVLFSGIVSMATLARAFAGYTVELVPGAPAWAVAPAFLAGLGLLNARGIRLASATNVVFTVIEASVIVVGAAFLAGGDAPPAGGAAEAASWSWAALLQGAALAFYAFIGFEDMVNVAEEVREPRRAFPVAIPLALVAVGATYAAVTLVATAVVSPGELAGSSAPLTDVVSRGAAWIPPSAFSAVALFAVANTALLNFVMASRLMYGMAGDGLLPRPLARVNRRWRTPHVAIVCVLVLAVALAATGGVLLLAGATSFLLLVVFFTMNLALVRIRGDAHAPATGFRCPRFVPWVGMTLCPALAVFLPGRSVLVAVAVIAVGVAFLGVWRSGATARG
jgi:amino acid transporter